MSWCGWMGQHGCACVKGNCTGCVQIKLKIAHVMGQLPVILKLVLPKKLESLVLQLIPKLNLVLCVKLTMEKSDKVN